MTEPIFRPWQPEDAQATARLWSQVFGDSVEVVLEIYDLFSKQPGFCAVGEIDGTIAAAAYCLDGLSLRQLGNADQPAAYLYAVATDPAFRSRGLAAQLCRVLRDWAFARGNTYLFTRPAEPTLFPWYAEKIGAIPALSRKMLAADAPCPGGTVMKLSPEAYGTRREALLRDVPHIALDWSLLQLENLFHRSYGGAFLDVDGGIADVYATETAVDVQELLLPPGTDPQRALEKILAHFGVRRGTAALPGAGECYISCAPGPHATTLPANAWFGPAFG